MFIATFSSRSVALLPAWSVKDHLLAGTLERGLSDYVTTVFDVDFGIYAFYFNRRHLSIKIRLCIDYWVAKFNKLGWI